MLINLPAIRLNQTDFMHFELLMKCITASMILLVLPDDRSKMLMDLYCIPPLSVNALKTSQAKKVEWLICTLKVKKSGHFVKQMKVSDKAVTVRGGTNVS